MKTLTTIVAILFTLLLNAQNFTGKAIYKTSRKSDFKIGGDQNGMTEEMQEQIRKRMQKMNQKTFILEFNKSESTYKQEAQLKAPSVGPKSGARVMVMSLGGSNSQSIYYKNIKKKKFTHQTDIMGKTFLVKDKLEKQEWVMSGETKNIGMYTCYKATFTKEVENKSIKMVNGEVEETIKKDTIVTTAWYTTQVPISNGPKDYQGLPGLILEINDGKNLMVCTEIVMNPKKKIIIKEPAKGEVVSLKKFTKIQKKKSDEMMERMKGRNGIDLGNGINIKMGGLN